MRHLTPGILAAAIVLTLGYGLTSATAQPPDAPPAIIDFSVDPQTITVAEAEDGVTEATFTWHTVGVVEPYRLVLQVYKLNNWEPVAPAGVSAPTPAGTPTPAPQEDALEPMGERVAPVEHPLNFGPPTYRLAIVDAAGNVVDERFAILTYAASPEGASPSITAFSTGVQQLESYLFLQGSVQFPVQWEVTGRTSMSNLVFEQVLAGNVVQSVELPRDSLWVPSRGEGMVSPVLPERGEPVRLRLRLVDLISGEALDAEELVIAVETTNTPAIQSFTAGAQAVDASVLRTGTARVPVAWEVVNRLPDANLVFEQIMPDGSAVSVELPRAEVMVPSTGQGVVAPVMPRGGANTIRLRLRVIDLTYGFTFDEREVTLAVSGTVARPTATPTPQPDVKVLYFQPSAAVVNRDSAITLRWQVTGVPVVTIYQHPPDPSGEGLRYEGMPPTGEIDLNVWQDYTDKVRFSLLTDATDSSGGRIGASIEVGFDPSSQIISFTANPDTVDKGGDVTLSWEVRNASHVKIFRYSLPDGEPEIIADNQPAAGSITTTVPAEYDELAIFELKVFDVGGYQSNAASVNVHIRCEYDFFFTPTGSYPCPAAPATDVAAALQTFENGYMLWRADTKQIFVLYSSGYPLLQSFQDTWVEGDVIDVGVEPPAGRYKPERGFGKVWAVQQSVRDRLGWATAPEQSYTARVQPSVMQAYHNSSATYITWPLDARVLVLWQETWSYATDG